MQYPGHIVKIDETDATVVRFIATQLTARGYKPTSPPGVFDKDFASLVKLFQAQTVDVSHNPLVSDGRVGPLTWGALGGEAAPGVVPAGPASLGAQALQVAITQIGVMEKPKGSNSGPEVDAYLASVGLPPGLPWCMAFNNFCVQKAARDAGVSASVRTLCLRGASPRPGWSQPGNRR